jgi:hypothetical protein
MGLIQDTRSEGELIQDLRRRVAVAEANLTNLLRGYERRHSNPIFIAVGPGTPIPGGP